MARPLDHLVMPVPSLAVARQRLSALGFTVAPDARHPFGTENACVFLSDGLYLEPLAIGDRASAERTAAEGNVFTGRDLVFRAACGDDGFSGLVVASARADADHARFSATGLSGGPILEFSRAALTADGQEVIARFRLAFAETGSPSFFLFSCERLNQLPADRAHLERHQNGVLGLRCVWLAADDPIAALPVLETVLETKAVADTSGHVFKAENGRVVLASRQGLANELGIDLPRSASGLCGEALVFATADLAVTADCLAANDVAFKKRGARIVVAAAPGQGAAFVFEE
jgi:hypothetical protein